MTEGLIDLIGPWVTSCGERQRRDTSRYLRVNSFKLPGNRSDPISICLFTLTHKHVFCEKQSSVKTYIKSKSRVDSVILSLENIQTLFRPDIWTFLFVLFQTKSTDGKSPWDHDLDQWTDIWSAQSYGRPEDETAEVEEWLCQSLWAWSRACSFAAGNNKTSWWPGHGSVDLNLR